jgi:hypothetical protein
MKWKVWHLREVWGFNADMKDFRIRRGRPQPGNAFGCDFDAPEAIATQSLTGQPTAIRRIAAIAIQTDISGYLRSHSLSQKKK